VVAGVCIAFLIGIVVRELGHVLAIRLARESPTAIHLMAPPDRIAFPVGGVRVGLGISLNRSGSLMAGY
jgi:hypothetical protein